MKNELNFFDRIMLAVTFAEAGLGVPEDQTTGQAGQPAPRLQIRQNAAARKPKTIAATT